MKKILVPVDFSGMSRNAADYAVSLAKVFDAEVQLLHVYREVLPATVGPEPWSVTVSDKRVNSERLIGKEVNFLRTRHGFEVNAELETGAKTKAINSAAGRMQANLIVMGMRSKRNRLLGSTTLHTIRKSKLPVLVVPDGTQFNSLKNIVLAVDFAEMLGSACMDVLFEIYKKFDSSLRVLHVETPGSDLKPSEVSEKMQLGLVLSRFNYQYERIEALNVEEGIQHFIDNNPTDLLVMIAHQHSVYERIFETIHTKALGLKIGLPLLILKHE